MSAEEKRDFYPSRRFDTYAPSDLRRRRLYRGGATAETSGNAKARILEINSKTGLYPLYATYSLFRTKRDAEKEPLSAERELELWDETVQENVFILCKTPMAKSIVKRTLAGRRDVPINARSFDDLIDTLKNKPQQFVERVQRPSFWNKQGYEKMKFDAVVGNPPYQEMDNGYRVSASPVYRLFIQTSKQLTPRYLSMIIPARWFAGGKGLDDFRKEMLTDNSIMAIHDFPEATDCFSGVQIKGGVCYFLWKDEYQGDCAVVTHRGSDIGSTVSRPLIEKECDVFIRYNEAISVLHKVKRFEEESFETLVSARKPFGLDTLFHGSKEGDVVLYENGGITRVSPNAIKKNRDWIYSSKVFIPEAGSGSDSFPHPILGRPFVGSHGTASTETYLFIGPFENDAVSANVVSYIATRFFRFLVMLKKPTQHATSKVYSFVPTQDFSKPWTDAKLYAKYGLTGEEIAFIESMIKPME